MMNIQHLLNTLKGWRAGSRALSRAKNWARAVPLNVWLAAGALLAASLWLHEHDARVRAADELQRTRQQTAQQVAALASRAEAAVRAANQQNAAAIAALESGRRSLAERARQLSAQLQSLKEQQQASAQAIAALSPAAIAEQMVERLGPASVVRGPSPSQVEAAGAQAQKAAVGRPPLPQGLDPSAVVQSGFPPIHNDSGTQSREQEQPTSVSPRFTPGNGPSSTDAGQLTLSAEGQRKVVTALSELDSCRAQSALQEQRLANCSQRIALDEKQIRTQADSLAKLNQALAAKDGILAAREAEYKTELAAARGTWLRRAAGALKFVAVGVGIGLVIR